MKSFFKKLAFVMALAMVVSMAAPAAANAAIALVAAHQTSKEVVTELEMEVGQEIDLCFLNAQKGWKELNRGWKVTKGEGVVTVDNNGLVKAVANGDATIEFFMEGYESAVVTITVGEEEEFYQGYGQTSESTVDFYFGEELGTVTKADVKLYRVYGTTTGKEVEVTWPVSNAYASAGGVLTVAPFVNFADGGQYRLVFKNETIDFTTVLPEIDEITYIETVYDTEDGIWWNWPNFSAFVAEEGDDEAAFTVKLGYKVWYMYEGTLMNVTGLFDDPEEFSMEYELVTPTEDSEDIDDVDFDSEGSVLFTAVVPAYVQAVASYDDEEGETVHIPVIGVEIVPTKRPELKINEVLDWAFDKVGNTSTSKFSWALKTIPAGEADDYEVVLKFSDTRGNVYVTKDAAKKNGNSEFKVFGADNCPLADLEYKFKYYSTNEDDFLIGEEDGIIETYKALKNAVFYVSLYQHDEDKDRDVLVDNIFATEFDLGEIRKFDMLYPAKKTLSVVADSIDGSEALRTASVSIAILDQYGDKIDISDNYGWKLTCSDKDVESGKAKGYMWYDYDRNNHVVTVTVDGAKLYEKTKSTSLSFTLTEKKSGESATFRVNIEKPYWVDSQGEMDRVANGTLKNIADGYFENNPLKDKYSYEIIIDQFEKKYDAISFKVLRNDPFNWLGSGSDGIENRTYGSRDNYHREIIVDLYKTSNGKVVGYQDPTDYIVVKDADWADITTGVINGHTVKEGDKFIALLLDGELMERYYGMYDILTGDAAEEYIKATTWDGHNDYNFDANGKVVIPMTSHYSNAADRISYAYSGDYELVVYTVVADPEYDEDEDAFIIKTEEESVGFTVRNELKKVTYDGRVKVSTPYVFDGVVKDLNGDGKITWDAMVEYEADGVTVTGWEVPDRADLFRIIVDCFDFKLGGNAWTLSLNWWETGDADDNRASVEEHDWGVTGVVDSATFEISGDKLIVKTVTFKVPVDYSTGLNWWGEDYYINNGTTVTINQSVTMGVE